MGAGSLIFDDLGLIDVVACESGFVESTVAYDRMTPIGRKGVWDKGRAAAKSLEVERATDMMVSVQEATDFYQLVKIPRESPSN